MHKNFSENFPYFGHTPSNMLANSVVGQKNVKIIGFKGCQIISLAGAPVCVQLALSAVDAAVTAQCEVWLVEFKSLASM